MSDENPTERMPTSGEGAAAVPAGPGQPNYDPTGAAPGGYPPAAPMAPGGSGPGTPTGPGGAGTPGAPKPRRALLWVLIALAAVIVVLLVVVIVLFAQSNSKNSAAVATVTPSASASPTPTPTHTTTSTPTPTSTSGSSSGSGSGSGSGGSGSGGTVVKPVITSFSVTPTTVTCSTGGPAVPAFTSTPLSISWSSTGGAKAYLGVDTSDAAANPYEEVVADSGSVNDIDYTCYDDQTYTLTVVGFDGTKVSKTITVTNNGDRP